jgi:hypothetical protein
VVLYRLLYLNFKLTSAKLSHFGDISQAFGTIVELKGGGVGRSMGLFYCLILSGASHGIRIVNTVHKTMFFAVVL